MTKNNLFPVAILPNINLMLPKTSHSSIGTSPYYAHQNAVAIDIYHHIPIENYKIGYNFVYLGQIVIDVISLLL